MKVPHLVVVVEEPAAFAPLAAALAAAGLRLGWLEWRPPCPLPPSLTAAAGLGALRAVAVGGGTVAAVKPLAGPPVLADLVRGHFLGCALVLVAGEDESTSRLPRLATEAGGAYRLRGAGGERRWDPAGLAARLRSPRPLAAGDDRGDDSGGEDGEETEAGGARNPARDAAGEPPEPGPPR